MSTLVFHTLPCLRPTIPSYIITNKSITHKNQTEAAESVKKQNCRSKRMQLQPWVTLKQILEWGFQKRLIFIPAHCQQSLSSCLCNKEEETPSQLWFLMWHLIQPLKGTAGCPHTAVPPSPLPHPCSPPQGKTTLGACQRSHDNRDSWPSQGVGMNQT